MVSNMSEQAAAEKPPRFSNLTLRLITAAIALPIALFTAYVDGWWMALVVALVTALGVVEFYILEQGRLVQGSSITGVPMAVAVIATFYLKQDALWLAALLIGALATLALEISRHPQEVRRSLLQVATTLAGVLYVAFPLGFLVAIRGLPDGWTWSLLVLILTWGTDTFAYFGGRIWGKTKLAPRLSPKKTVEGAVTGIVGGMTVAALWLLIYSKLSLTTIILIGIAPLAAIAGDLAESAMKRFFQVKDSHIAGLDILPGHGGVLDRIDSLLAVSAFSYFYLRLTGIAV
jgi:phosphatidate cytidylyltransferase